jgi:redox-sensitive bicupin YhaK (pirin superfamily)
VDVLPSRRHDLGDGMVVTRALPAPGRRTVGPWCFVDVFGPVAVDGPERDVRPHPHIGLATVTWLLSGAIVHRDSLGSVQPIRPGQLNWMTAGAGITHSEHFQPGDPLRGLQLWFALPEAHRADPPSFLHVPAVPTVSVGDARCAVWCGAVAGVAGAVVPPHPAVGFEGRLDGAATLPLAPDFEHVVVWLDGAGRLDGEELPLEQLVYLPVGTPAVTLTGTGTFVVLGGAPFGPLLLWWNFAARTRAEMVAAQERWESGGFAAVPDVVGRIPAPPVPPLVDAR